MPGKINLRGTNRLQRLNSIHGEGESQFMPGQRQDITYISRLQSMQAAVDHQLEQMSKEHPDRRVALVSFNNEVQQLPNRGEIFSYQHAKFSLYY